MILITTSNGVFRLGAEGSCAQLVLPRRKGLLFLRKGSGGFFGIAPHPDGNSFLAASREKLGTPRNDKPWTDVRLHRVWKEAGRNPEVAADLLNIHDVHQIATAGQLVLLTDTGKNRIGVHDLNSGGSWSVDVGPERRDVNHLNALHVAGDQVLIGLNNRGDQPAAILEISLEMLQRQKSEIDLLDEGDLQVLGTQTHTHDVEPFGDDYLYCASHDGKVHRRSTGEIVLEIGGWVRGLAVNSEGLWIGASPLAERSQRHREDLDGQVHLFDPATLEKKKTWPLEGAGQVNDIVAW